MKFAFWKKKAKTEPAKAEPAKAEPAKTEVKADPAKAAPKAEKPKHTEHKFGKQAKKEGKKKKQLKFTTRGFAKVVNLQEHLEKAGLDKDPVEINNGIVRTDIILCSIFSAFMIGRTILLQGDFFQLAIFLAVFWIVAYFMLLGVLWMVYLFYLDMRIFKRTQEVEAVFPDFLQLASSNISAGMPIDRALWYAVRPNFGVLAKEIEMVAKSTLAGEDLADALRAFARKYDSKVIKRSINLILEGLAAGGELAELLSKIALDIEETRILKRDMAANVTTYVIFISFATIMASPVLLALSTQLLQVIQGITAGLGDTVGNSGSMSFFSISPDAIKVSDFKIFAYFMMAISSTMAACIVNVIQKGRVKEGISKIPVYILISYAIYLASYSVMSGLFAGLMTT